MNSFQKCAILMKYYNYSAPSDPNRKTHLERSLIIFEYLKGGTDVSQFLGAKLNPLANKQYTSKAISCFTDHSS